MAAAASDTSLEELKARLVTFTEQLQNIHELLQTDAENAEFLSIAADLVEVIRLTKEAVRLMARVGVLGWWWFVQALTSLDAWRGRSSSRRAESPRARALVARERTSSR